MAGLSTLAPVFAIAFATHQPRYAFLAGLATAIGAGVSMAFSEGLSDTGDLTGRSPPVPARRDHRRRHVPRRCPAHAAVPHPPVPAGGAGRARGDRVRTPCAGLDSPAVLRHRLPQLARLSHARRGDHRYDQRRVGCTQMTTGDASARTRKKAPSLSPHKDLTCTPRATSAEDLTTAQLGGSGVGVLGFRGGIRGPSSLPGAGERRRSPIWLRVVSSVCDGLRQMSADRPAALVPHSNAGLFIPVIRSGRVRRTLPPGRLRALNHQMPASPRTDSPRPEGLPACVPSAFSRRSMTTPASPS